MPAMTVDGQSFALDGRRLWLVSGTVPYARIPRGLWPDRLAAARQAGLNCIETPVVWALHEPRQGSFNFEGDLDLEAFVTLVGEMRMHCILRIGPHVGDGYDLGGIPDWLLADDATRAGLRSSEPTFLHAVSRFTGQVCDRVKDLQATSSRRSAGGPVVLVQSEHHWFCADPAQGDAYLREIERYLREDGITVPISNSNNLFHSVEGQIDGWFADHHLFANLRQLRAVRPDQPRLLSGLPMGPMMTWGTPPSPGLTPRVAMRRLAEVLATGAQYNIAPFTAGSGLYACLGQTEAGPDGFVASSIDQSAPVNECGARGPLFDAVRRISTFASSFGRVFSSLDPGYRPVVSSLDPGAGRGGKAKAKPTPCAQAVAVECRGTQGSVVFVFGPEEEGGGPVSTTIVLEDGSTLPVALGDHPVAWVLLNAHLGGKSTLDYCSLSAFAASDSLFVCFGPAGAPGIISINDSAFEVTVPSGDEPLIREHEGVTVIVCNQSSIDRLYLADGGALAGCAGLDSSGAPLPHPDSKRLFKVVHGQKSQTIKPDAKKPARRAPSLGGWSCASVDGFVTGEGKGFKKREGPTPVEAMDTALGYAWCRVRFKGAGAKAAKAMAPFCGGRTQLFLDGVPVALLGDGPGASGDRFALPLKKQDHTLVALAERFGGRALPHGAARPSGLFGHVYEIASIKTGAPKVVQSLPMSPLSVRTPIFGLEIGDLTDAHRLAWSFEHRRKTPVILAVDPIEEPGVVFLNDVPVAVITPWTALRMVLPEERSKRGKNTLAIAVVGDMEHAAKSLRAGVHLLEGAANLTENAEWGVAPFSVPADGAFEEVARSALNARATGRPCWWRTGFKVDGTDRPLFLETAGLSKGRILLNGRDVGRYFVATADGKSVPPQKRCYLPEPWLNADGDNDLLVFDEHGATPNRVKLTYDEAPVA